MSHDVRSAAILAGGRATRFGGRDKSALLVDGRAILDRQIDALAPLAGDLMIVGGDAAVTDGLAVPDVPARQTAPRLIADLVPGCGPLGGLHAALTAARAGTLFLVACDMPYLSTAFVAHLFSLAGEADVVVPKSERGYHPLCAVYTRACLDVVAAQLGNRRLRMLELVDRMRTRIVPVDEIRPFGDPDRLLANVNTPADYAGLETLQGHKL
jgi:molybdopterin-guanine dinucleotide biosynthesis protein A